ncbi:SigB/SigF/SigG family RNA polymerase sigma factor [Natroniella acetigena]|uniref:SigB/SigF/SigG family RNA polymerase sigma factor n=1 Tax=Natroniella acetigena TaxID=52004 RepID=UPI00200B27F2|nr:SigB/SigF/SigG family RNA polymerase sigma factor [Natroniella acetigena]MCK8828279.1 SigB/SigF/SigG family RNA polymerase sigma factor [Natroniella acetigena]
MGSVELTGVDTSKLPVLSNEEMMELFKQMNAGQQEARRELISSNLKLVLSVLQRYRNSNHPVDDLFQIGCVGLVKAVDNFDLDKGVRFSTYAVPMIIGEIKRYLRDNREIRISRSLRNTAYRAMQLKERLRKKNAEEPTLGQIAEKLEMSREEVVYALEATKSPISLFKPVFEDEGEPIRLVDQLSEEEGLELTDEINIREALKVLTARERLIIKLRFYRGRTQSEVAERIGVSQAQISRLQKRALNKLHEAAAVKEGN